MNPDTSSMSTAVPLPPGGPIEIVFSFDTTGSMSECLDQVRGQLSHVIERLNADIPGLRIAVFAHGDYCDLKEYGYVTKHVDFTNDVTTLCHFVNDVGGTGGGDFEECYELVLRQVRQDLSWQQGTQKALVMIGDATPHGVDDRWNEQKIDWREETERLANDMGVRIYSVQCLNNTEADDFYRHLAETSGGKHLKLDELTSIVEMMMAICYREKGAEYFEDYEKEIRQREGAGMRADLERMFVTLKNGPAAEVKASTSRCDATDMETRESDSSEDEGGDVPFVAPPCMTKTRKRKMSSGSDSSASSSTPSAFSGGSAVTKRRRRTTGKDKMVASKSTTEKALRERLAQKDFVLSPLRWSHWKEAITPGPSAEEGWRQRNGSHLGSRKSRLFEDMSEPAVYEMGVQPQDSKVKIPVLASVTVGLEKIHWERAFMSQKHIQEQVDNVLRRGCKLFVRRAQFATDDLPSVYDKAKVSRKVNTSDDDENSTQKAVRELRGLVTKVCDYAWRKHYDPDSHKYVHRALVKKGVVISE